MLKGREKKPECCKKGEGKGGGGEVACLIPLLALYAHHFCSDQIPPSLPFPHLTHGLVSVGPSVCQFFIIIERLPIIFLGHELVQYGVQGSGASSSSARGQPRSREREDQYGRREWSQGQQQQQQQQQSEFDVVHHLFNG